MSTVDFLLDLLYPPVCVSCGELQRAGVSVPICRTCLEAWELQRRVRCKRCKSPHSFCNCKPALLEGNTVSLVPVHLVPYDPANVTGRLILALKDRPIPRLTDFLAGELADNLLAQGLLPIHSDPGPAVITYLPRSADRKADAGTDQAKALAKALSKRLNMPLCKAFARKSAPPQKDLSADERIRAARRTYRLAKGFRIEPGATVYLVDDILTTGASVLAGAELLRAAGVGEIIALTLGQTPLSKEHRKK